MCGVLDMEKSYDRVNRKKLFAVMRGAACCLANSHNRRG